MLHVQTMRIRIRVGFSYRLYPCRKLSLVSFDELIKKIAVFLHKFKKIFSFLWCKCFCFIIQFIRNFSYVLFFKFTIWSDMIHNLFSKITLQSFIRLGNSTLLNLGIKVNIGCRCFGHVGYKTKIK